MCNQCILPSVIYVNEPLDETFSGDTMFRAAMFSLRSFHVQGIANGGIPLCYTGTATVYKIFHKHFCFTNCFTYRHFLNTTERK